MRTFTNLAWPDDPYRASQLLYKQPSPMLAAFALLPAAQDRVTAPAAVAVVYLPLHRTRAMAVTEDTLTFGFRAAGTAETASIPQIAEAADLDLMQARRHARFLTGHALAASLHALGEAAPGLVTRGLAAVESGWASRQHRAQGLATMIDLCDSRRSLAAICRSAAITASPASMASKIAPAGPEAAERLAAAATERALAIALACTHQLGRYRWQATMHTGRVMAAAAWDLFPATGWDDTHCKPPAQPAVTEPSKR